jgi:hypothetical protein
MANLLAVADNGLGKDIWTVPHSSITTLLHVRTARSGKLVTMTDNILSDLLRQRDPLHHHPAPDQGIDHLYILAHLPGGVVPMAGILRDRLEHRLRYRIPHRHSLTMPAYLVRLEQMGQGA